MAGPDPLRNFGVLGLLRQTLTPALHPHLHLPLRRTINPRRMRRERISLEEPQALASYFEPWNGFLAA
jgi:hypothetical protein